MTRHLLLLAALVASFSAASAQGLYVEPGDDGGDMSDGPPVMAGTTDDVTAIGESMKDLADGDLGWGAIWWIATTFSPHIPVDPNCPPPDGCPQGDPPDDGDDPPAGGDDPPGGGEGDPPGGGETPPGGGDTPPDGGTPSGGDEEPQASTSAKNGCAPTQAPLKLARFLMRPKAMRYR